MAHCAVIHEHSKKVVNLVIAEEGDAAPAGHIMKEAPSWVTIGTVWNGHHFEAQGLGDAIHCALINLKTYKVTNIIMAEVTHPVEEGYMLQPAPIWLEIGDVWDGKEFPLTPRAYAILNPTWGSATSPRSMSNPVEVDGLRTI